MACNFILLTVFTEQNFICFFSLPFSFLPFLILRCWGLRLMACRMLRESSTTALAGYPIQTLNLYKVWVITSFCHRLCLYRSSELNSSQIFFHFISRFFLVLVYIGHLISFLRCILVCSLSVHVHCIMWPLLPLSRDQLTIFKWLYVWASYLLTSSRF